MREKLIETALLLLHDSNKELEFKDLWVKTLAKNKVDLEQSVEYISDFYSDLSLDNRFICIDKNKWDLRARRKVSEIIINTEDFIDEEEKIEE